MGVLTAFYWQIVNITGYILRIMGGVFSSIGGRQAIIMTEAKKQLVNDLIKSDKIVIFSKTYCPYCKLAKEVFEKVKEKFTVVELDQRDDGDEIQAVLGEITGAKTVPRVFVKGECLGGGSDVKNLYDKGELQKYL